MASFASAFAGAGSRQRRDGGANNSNGGGGSGGMSNPIHFQPPAVAVPRSTVVTDDKGKPVALHTVRLEHEGWVWHVHLQWRQLQALASALQRWRWRVFFFPGAIPPLPAIHEGQAVRSPPRAHAHRHHHHHHHHQRYGAWDDHDLEWAGRGGYHEQAQEEDTTVLADAEVASVFSSRSGLSTERGGRASRASRGGGPGQRRGRRAHSAPPVSSSGSEGEEEDGGYGARRGPPQQRRGGRARQQQLQPRRGYVMDEEEEWGAEEEEDEATGRRRRQQRRERRRWEYYSHRASLGAAATGDVIRSNKDLRFPLSPRAAAQTDAAALALHRTAYERYLRAALGDVALRHCPALLELLEISAHTFDAAQGPSFREGYLAGACYWAKDGAAAEEEESEAAGLGLGGLVAAAMEGADGLGPKKTALPGALHQPAKRPPPPHARALQRCYAVLKAGSLALYAARDAPAPEAVLLFEAGTRVEAFPFDASTTAGPRRLVLHNALWRFELILPSLVPQRLWAAALQAAVARCPLAEAQGSRFAFTRALPTSYLDASAVSTAQWFVDGDAVYRAYAAAIKGAKTSVLIAGQWVCPDLFLRRPAHRFPESRLDRLLDARAKEGVNIYVLLPSPPPTTPDPDPDTSNPAAGLNPRYTQTRLLGLPHAPGRIHVLLAAAPLGASGAQAWTHHDNLLIVDQELAFIGSTTLGLGQWDTAHHLLKDDTVHSGGQGGLRASRRLVQPAARPYSLSSHPTQQAAKPRARKPVWPGRDYWNPLAKDMVGVEKAHLPAADLPFHDRSCVPRLPHHTAAVALGGSAARDACWHFIARWELERARHHARLALLKRRKASPDILLAAGAALPPTPALVPTGIWRMRGAPLVVQEQEQGLQALASSSFTEAAPRVGGAGVGAVKGSGGKDGGAVLARKTIARLVFGPHSSAAPPPPRPEGDGVLTSAERAHKDVLTEVEEAASSKVRAWLRPARKIAARRLLELAHDQGPEGRAELWGKYQALITSTLPLAPRPPRPTIPTTTARRAHPTNAKRGGGPHRPLLNPASHATNAKKSEEDADADWFEGVVGACATTKTKYEGSPPGAAGGGEKKAAIPTTDVSGSGGVVEEGEEEPVFKPLKPSTVRAHVLASRGLFSSSFSAEGGVGSPVQVMRVEMGQQASPSSSPSKHQHHYHLAAEAEAEPTHTQALSAQRVQQAYFRLKRTGRLKATEDEEEAAASMGPAARCHARVVRSLGKWSGGLAQTESGILEAYEQLIASARHYLYLEAPAFVSGLRGDPLVGNRVAEALVNRIVRAHDRGERFRALLLLPLLPAYDGPLHGATTATLTSALYHQLQTVRQILARLRELVDDPEEYILFLSLRTYTRMNGRPALGTGPQFVAQQIHVNSRLLIADDRHCLLGSAALNDRSLAGGRDSEVCVVLEDTEPSDCTPSAAPTMDGKPFPQAGRFARALRLRLWAEHLGLLDDKVRASVLARLAREGRGPGMMGAEEEDGSWGLEGLVDGGVTPEEVAFAPILDPVAPETWAFLRRTARRNTAILAHVFPRAVPAAQITSLEALKQVTLQQAALPATYDFVHDVLGEEQAQDEEDMLDGFLLAHGGPHAPLQARGEEGSVSDASDDCGGSDVEGEEGDGDYYDAAAMDAEEAAFLEAQLTDERRATLRWLRRLRGHLVQYPVEFLAEDLPALKPINGLEGWVV